MKKLKFVAMLLTALLVGAGFTACSNDEEEDNNPAFVGTWCAGENDNAPDYEEYVAYYANGTGKQWVSENGETSHEKTFTWTAEGNKITICFDNGNADEIYWNVEGDKIIFSQDADFEDSAIHSRIDKPSTGGGDNNSGTTSSALVGTWDEDTDYIMESLHYTFNADGTGKFIYEDGEPESFRWSVSGNRITLSANGQKASEYWKIEGGKLYLSEYANFPNDNETGEETHIFVKRK